MAKPDGSSNNVDLFIAVRPNPLSGQMGSYDVWFNNNNGWNAQIGAITIDVLNPATAELDLVVAGTRSRSRSANVGSVGAWRSSNPVATGVAAAPGASSSGEVVSVTCAVGRAMSSPGAPPPPLYPLSAGKLVSI
jgi:hypothetical protein